jgi:hypothetical protein
MRFAVAGHAQEQGWSTPLKTGISACESATR